VIFVVVVGEELGWRGFALPHLLRDRSALAASLILGLLWSAWHLPTFLVPGTPQYGKSIIAFVPMTTAYSVLLCYLYTHGGQRPHRDPGPRRHQHLPGNLLGGVDPAQHYWLLAGVYWTALLGRRFVTVSTTVKPQVGPDPQRAEVDRPQRPTLDPQTSAACPLTSLGVQFP
jgi:hypothetical protein